MKRLFTLRHLWLSLLAVIMTAVSAAAESVPGIVVVRNDGSRTEYALSAIDRINLSESELNVVLESGEQPAAVAYADIDRILIGKGVSGIISTLAEGDLAVWPTVTDGTLNITGAHAGTNVNVFSVGGSLLLSEKVASDGSAQLDLSPLPSGLCVVTVGRHSVKVIKK